MTEKIKPSVCAPNHPGCKWNGSIERMDEKINQIHHILIGNGTQGLIRKVEQNTKLRYMAYGISSLLGFLTFGLLVKMYFG